MIQKHINIREKMNQRMITTLRKSQIVHGDGGEFKIKNTANDILITRYVIPKQRAKHKHENTNMTPLISVRLEEMRSNQLRYFQHPNFVSSIKYTLQLKVTLNLPLV